MKKLLFLTAIVSLLFVGCNNDNENYDPNDPSRETVRKLPSRIVSDWGDSRNDTINFEYDDLNRLVRVTKTLWSRSSSPPTFTYTFTHNVNDEPIGFSVRNNGSSTGGSLLHSENQVVFEWTAYDTLILGANGRLERIVSRQWGGSKYTYNYTYNSDGNLTRVQRERKIWYAVGDGWGVKIIQDTTELEYANSSARSIWRHVNMPNWFVTYFISDVGLRHSSSWSIFHWDLIATTRIGLMPTQKNILERERCWNTGEMIVSNRTHTFAYAFDADGYVRQIDAIRELEGWTETRVFIIEYIPAR